MWKRSTAGDQSAAAPVQLSDQSDRLHAVTLQDLGLELDGPEEPWAPLTAEFRSTILGEARLPHSKAWG